MISGPNDVGHPRFWRLLKMAVTPNLQSLYGFGAGWPTWLFYIATGPPLAQALNPGGPPVNHAGHLGHLPGA
jgi:hypothetical protein